MSVTPARKYRAPRVTPRLTRASMIGRPAATRLVKASSSTMRVIGKLTRSACSRSWREISFMPLVEGGGPAGLDLDPGRHALAGRRGDLGDGLELGVLVAGEAGDQVGGAPVGRDEGRAAGGGERLHPADARDGPDPGGDPLDDRPEGGVVDRPGLVVDGDQGGGRELVGEALLEVALDGQRLGAGHLEPARPEPVGEPGGVAGHDGQQHHPGPDDPPPAPDGEGPEPSQQAPVGR